MSGQAADIQRELAARNADDLVALVALLLATHAGGALSPVRVVPAEPGQPAAVGVDYAGESWYLEVTQ